MFLSLVLHKVQAWAGYWKGLRELRSLTRRELSELGLERRQYRGATGSNGWDSLRQVVLESR